MKERFQSSISSSEFKRIVRGAAPRLNSRIRAALAAQGPPPPAKAIFYPIKPVPWVRESNRDKWDPRPEVQRYRAFRDEVARHHVMLPIPGVIGFYVPMPESWSKRDRAAKHLTPHTQVPDVDQFLKALLDAIFPKKTTRGDAHVWAPFPIKRWSYEPGILIVPLNPGMLPL